jgi:hypothetical protein
MDEQKTLNEQLEAFKQQNPKVMEAIRVLNIDVDQYLRTLAQMTPSATTATNKTCGG